MADGAYRFGLHLFSGIRIFLVMGLGVGVGFRCRGSSERRSVEEVFGLDVGGGVVVVVFVYWLAAVDEESVAVDDCHEFCSECEAGVDCGVDSSQDHWCVFGGGYRCNGGRYRKAERSRFRRRAVACCPSIAIGGRACRSRHRQPMAWA